MADGCMFVGGVVVVVVVVDRAPEHVVRMIPCCVYFLFFSSSWSAYICVSLHSHWPVYQRRHCNGPVITYECVYMQMHRAVLWLRVCLFWWRLVPSSFITGLLQRDHLCFCWVFLLFSLLFDKHFEPSRVCQRSVSLYIASSCNNKCSLFSLNIWFCWIYFKEHYIVVEVKIN